MALQRDGGQWYAVERTRHRLQLVDDGTAPDSSNPGEETSVDVGWSAWRPKLPPKMGRSASFGPYLLKGHGQVYLVKLPNEIDVVAPGVIELTPTRIKNVVGGEEEFNKLRAYLKGDA